MVLVPGRNALSFPAPRAPGRAIVGALLVPLLTGLAAQRCFDSLHANASAAIASLSRIELPLAESEKPAIRTPRSTQMLGMLGNPDLLPDVLATSRTEACLAAPEFADDAPRALAHSATFATTIAPMGPSTLSSSAVVNVRSVIQAIAGRRRGMPSDDELNQVPTNGILRLQALHLGEELSVRPFDDSFRPNPDAFAQINHALRCRITGSEINIDPRLVTVLVQLHSLYNRPIQLVSGHRTPLTIGTKKTSQHTLGRAADIRIPGVSIEELRRVAIKFGARGVGLYPEKGFVHVDVRQQNRYYWQYTAAQGEQADMGLGMVRRKPVAAVETTGVEPDSANVEVAQDSEGESESADDSE
jgi:uncharacterized protein YcbK (DUF882 family)